MITEANFNNLADQVEFVEYDFRIDFEDFYRNYRKLSDAIDKEKNDKSEHFDENSICKTLPIEAKNSKPLNPIPPNNP